MENNIKIAIFDIEKIKSDLNSIKEKCIEPLLEKMSFSFSDIKEIILSLDRLENFIQNTDSLQKIISEGAQPPTHTPV